MKRLFLLFGLALLLLPTSGCLLSEQPLSAISQAKPDPQLVGQWQSKDKPSPEKNPGAASKEPESLLVSFDEHGIGHARGVFKNAKVGPETGRFFVTRTARNTYLNVQDPASRSSNYSFYKYRVSSDAKSAQVWTIRSDPFDAAIKAGRLKGKLDVHPPSEKGEKGEKGANIVTYTLLQDSSDRILTFIESQPDKKLLEEPTSWKKVP